MRHFFITAFLGSSFIASASEQTPLQSWSDYRVHQADRPHPEKITGVSCVTTPAPSDAIVLFDGANTDAFTVAWPVRDGVMVVDAKDNHSKQSFGDCQLHIEWRIPSDRKVIGQQGGNSGVYLMDRYEVQVQESHTNETYADGQAAAIYGQNPPLVNASAPQGEWQSYDIFFTAPIYDDNGMVEPARITVIHNGVVVQNATEIYGETTHKKLPSYPETHPEKAPIRLQWHDDPIEYRNIWVRPLD